MNVVNMASWMELRIGRRPDGQSTFFNLESFPWVQMVEANWMTIRRELDLLLQHKEDIPNLQDVSPEQSAVAHGDSWKSFSSTASVTRSSRIAPFALKPHASLPTYPS